VSPAVDGPLCECSWSPHGPVALATALEAHHTARMHVDGRGRCTGRDSYGAWCSCPAFTPMRDDDEDDGGD